MALEPRYFLFKSEYNGDEQVIFYLQMYVRTFISHPYQCHWLLHTNGMK